jgi:hypothetical protein
MMATDPYTEWLDRELEDSNRFGASFPEAKQPFPVKHPPLNPDGSYVDPSGKFTIDESTEEGEKGEEGDDEEPLANFDPSQPRDENMPGAT